MFLRPSFKSCEMASRRAPTSNDVRRPTTSRTETAPFFRMKIVNVPFSNAFPLRRGQDCTAGWLNEERISSDAQIRGPSDYEATILLSHDYAQAAPPTFRQAHAHDFKLTRQKSQKLVRRRMEAQGWRHKIDNRRNLLQFDAGKIAIARNFSSFQVLPHAQPVIRSLQHQVNVLAGL